MYDEDAKPADESNYSRSWFRDRRKLNEQDLQNLHPYVRSKYLAVRTYVSFIYFTVLLCLCHPTLLARAFLGCPVVPFVRSRLSGSILLLEYPMNGLNNFDKTDREYLLVPTDDLFRFRRSKVKGEGRGWPWQRHPRRRWRASKSIF